MLFYENNSILFTNLKYSFRCLLPSVNNTILCEWNFLGSGIEYQLLAGPAFAAIFSVMGIILGILGDMFNR